MNNDTLPKFKNELILSHENAITGDIITKLNAAFSISVKDTAEFAEQFRGKNCYESAKNVWYYLKHKVKYKKDPEGKQIIKYPNALVSLKDSVGSDCKSFSLFASSILYNLGCEDIRLRYVSYRNDTIPTHVYCVFKYQNRDVPVDAVINYFDHENKFNFKKDYKMNVYELSGVENNKEINHLYTLWNDAPKKSLCKHLLLKELNRKKGKHQNQLILNDYQKNYYRKKLEYHVKWHKKNNHINLCYQLKLQELRDLNDNNIVGYLAGENTIEGIGKFRLRDISINTIKKDFKKYALSVNRNAFLLLVIANIFNLAVRLKSSKMDKINNIWRKLGGDTDKLRGAIKTGYNKGLGSKHRKDKIQGNEQAEANINGIGNPAIAASIAAAAPIVLALLKALSNGKEQKKNPDGSPMVDASGQPVMEEGKPLLEVLKKDGVDIAAAGSKIYKIFKKDSSGEITDELQDGVVIADKEKPSNKLLLIGGAVLAAILILKPKS